MIDTFLFIILVKKEKILKLVIIVLKLIIMMFLKIQFYLFLFFTFSSISFAGTTLNVTTIIDTIRESDGHYQLVSSPVQGVTNLGVYSLRIQSDHSNGIKINVNSSFSGTMRLNSEIYDGYNLTYLIVAQLNNTQTTSLTGNLSIESTVNLAQSNSRLLTISNPTEAIDATFYIRLSISAVEFKSAFRSEDSIFSDVLEFVAVELD